MATKTLLYGLGSAGVVVVGGGPPTWAAGAGVTPLVAYPTVCLWLQRLRWEGCPMVQGSSLSPLLPASPR